MIGGHVATVALFPIGTLARKAGRAIPDPRRYLERMRWSGPLETFVRPPGLSPFFLGAGKGYEPGMCSIVERLDGGVFVDVGASIGFITARAARRVDRVFAIEPHPVRFEFLRRNVELNALSNVTCIDCALGTERGEVDLYDVEPSLGPHPLDVSTRPGTGRRYTVPVERLDDLLDDDADFVKIDVEGAEVEVLKGAPRTIASRPRMIVESLGHTTLPTLEELLPDSPDSTRWTQTTSWPPRNRLGSPGEASKSRARDS